MILVLGVVTTDTGDPNKKHTPQSYFIFITDVYHYTIALLSQGCVQHIMTLEMNISMEVQ